ncbi:uncharacterized protein LOC120081083 [Benincasa hispida]|uniref:uncharacterized protein LOC120081083 n=1 Tax=Benincasa hispida TaxID=102211 RepID=UPI001900D2E5|nr:uncharacterized protein LOC120081083 [Benincasa hispida]
MEKDHVFCRISTVFNGINYLTWAHKMKSFLIGFKRLVNPTLQPIWTQLDQAKISVNHLRLIKVLMGPHPEYESIRAALLHRGPLPSLNTAIQEILFEEKRLGIASSRQSEDSACKQSFSCKKQSVFSRLSTESEYHALVDATSKLLWLCWLLADMGVSQLSTTILHCDNHSAIQIARNDVFHEGTKHIKNDCHFVRHHLQSKALLLQAISTTEQPANIFTKALSSSIG